MNKEPKICLIDVMDKGSSSLDPPLNLVCLANYLTFKKLVKKENIKILSSVYDDVEEEVSNLNPDIIGFSLMTPFFNTGLELAWKLKKQSKAKFIIGGYHISAIPETLEKPFDIGVMGEGEYSLAHLVKLWRQGKFENESELEKVPGIVFFDKNGKVRKSIDGVIVNVNDLPVVDWSIVPEQRVIKYVTIPVNGKMESRRMTSMYTARGCPYSCAFCAHRVLTHGQKGVRYFDLDRVIDEIDYLVRVYKVDCIQILDDTFAVSKERIKEFIKRLKDRRILGKIVFYNLFVRANIIDDEFAALLKELGASTVFIGIESGSQNVLRLIKDGPLSAEMVKKAIGCFEKNEIYVVGSFMMFSPQEKEEDLEKSIKLATWFSKRKNTFALVFSITTPYPGTKLWTEALKNGIVDSNNPHWEDFMMFFLRDVQKMPKVFYTPDWADDEKMYGFWKRFIVMADSVRENVKKIKGWKEATAKSTRRNLAIHKSWMRMKHQEQFENRLKRFGRNPVESFKKLINKPKIFLFIWDDIKTMLFNR